MKKFISIILMAVLVFTMAIPAMAGTASSQESISIVDSIENPVINSIFSKISNIINKIYNFVMNIIFPKKIAVTWRYIDDSSNWVEKTEYYEYGEQLKPYTVPQKVHESSFSFTVYYFKSWSPELEEIVTQDVTYEAVYAAIY